MLDLIKYLGKGFLYIIASPLIVVCFAIFIIFSIIQFLVMEVVSLIKFLSGKSIKDYDSNEKRLVECRNATPPMGMPSMNQNPFFQSNNIMTNNEDEHHE